MALGVVNNNVHKLCHIFFVNFLHSVVLVEDFSDTAKGILKILLLSLISQK